MKKKDKKLYLQSKRRYLKKVTGTAKKPRLSVFRSHKHIYAQLIDDALGITLASSSTLEKQVKLVACQNSPKEAASLVGKVIAQKASEKSVKLTAFDRGNRSYQGRIQSLAEGARLSGLLF